MMFQAPRLTGGSDRAQIEEMGRYLHTLADQLNLVLMDMQSTTGTMAGKVDRALSEVEEKTDPASNWNQIKSLIIKSADIVEVYQEKISSTLRGEYVAVSDFGTFAEETKADLEATSQGITQIYNDLQTIETDFQDLSYAMIEVNAHINSGLLYYDDKGVPIYGLEIGQRTAIDGEETFNKFARFTADKLSFYDPNGTEVAYISDRRLHIAHVDIQSSMLMGGFRDTVQSDGSVVTRWIGV
jgi:hypothetical protein